MNDAATPDAARAAAIRCASRIFYRPQAVVDTLIAAFRDLPRDQYPGPAAVAQTCFERPIRMGGTTDVFGLRPRHWPMLNLLDGADRDRRAFGAAMAAAVNAARTAGKRDGVA